MAALHMILLIAAASVVATDALVNASAAGARKAHLRVQSFPSSASDTANASGSNAITEPGLPAATVAPEEATMAATAAPEAPAAATVAPEVATMAATTAAPSAPVASMVEVQPKRATPAPLPPSGAAIVNELRAEVGEVKQHRTNIVQMQQALTADVALLRESSALQRVSASRHSRTAAQLQVRKTEQLVKDLSGMLRDGRADAMEDARTMLREANEVRAAAAALASEASAELHALAPRSGRHRKKPVAAAAPVALSVSEPMDPTVPAAATLRTDVAPVNSTMAADAPGLDVDDGEEDDVP